jgi:hypothetical protein
VNSKPFHTSSRLMSVALVVMGGAARATAQINRVHNPVGSFVGGFNPTDEDFFGHDSADTFLVRMRFDADLDGREDLALSETSVFGVGGGPWLLFRQQPQGGYQYLGEFFAGPSAVAVARDPTGRARLTVEAAVGVAVNHAVTYRVTANRLIKLAERDSPETGGTQPRPSRVVLEWCALSTYRRAPSNCWRAGWPPK